MHYEDELEHPERRRALGGIAAGVVAMSAAGAARAQGGGSTEGAAPSQTVMRNPHDQYFTGNFPQQRQPYPGLASKMDPRPDHGETSYQGTNRLLGRKALITGGDSGIGRAAAIAYAREGADVAITYLPVEESDAREVVALIRSAGRKAVAIPGDLRDRKFCDTLVKKAVEGLGGLDILVNCAGIQQKILNITDLEDQQFEDTFKVNMFALFYICKAAVPHLPAGAAIINTSSIAAYEGGPGFLDYASTKAGIVTFTKALAKQLATKGVRVNVVIPGTYWTPLQISGGQLPADIPPFGKRSAMERAGQPAEIAAAYVHLASQETSYMTGTVIGSTGGLGGP